jgi:hypothetical protein
MLTTIFLIVLIVILFLLYKFVNFLNTNGKFLPSSLVVLFLNEIKKIENGGEGTIVLKTFGDFKIISIVKDSKVFDSISVDIKNSKVYSGTVSNNSPNRSDILIPTNVPYNSNNVDELRLIEDDLVTQIMDIIVKYESE